MCVQPAAESCPKSTFQHTLRSADVICALQSAMQGSPRGCAVAAWVHWALLLSTVWWWTRGRWGHVHPTSPPLAARPHCREAVSSVDNRCDEGAGYGPPARGVVSPCGGGGVCWVCGRLRGKGKADAWPRVSVDQHQQHLLIGPVPGHAVVDGGCRC